MTTDRRKALFVLPSLEGGGAERMTLTILRHLDRTRFEPHLAVVVRAGHFLPEVPEGVPVHDLKASRVRYAGPALVRLAWKLEPDVVLSTLGELNLLLILARPFLPRGMKLLIREGTVASLWLSQDVRHGRALAWLYRRCYKRADRIVCQSDYMLEDLAEHFAVPRMKLARIYNPVDVERIRQQASAGGNPFLGPGPHVVAAGRLSREKGFDILLDAMALVHATVPSAQLTVLGEGSREADLKARRERLGLGEVVHFVGFQSNPALFFKHADLFVLSSRYEGLPNVVLEALALGTPVVATDCPGGAREILGDLSCARLVPNSDARLLAEAICTALRSGRGVAADDASLEGVLSRFRVERVVREFEDLLSL